MEVQSGRLGNAELLRKGITMPQLVRFGRATLIATVLMAISLYLVCDKLARPSTIRVVVEGSETRIEQIPNLYTPADVAWIAGLSMVFAGSLVYLLSRQLEPKPRSADEQRKRWERVAGNLRGAERVIYEYIMDKEGVAFQNEIVEGTGLGKGTVSIALGRLQAKELVDRRRSGLMNVVALNRDRPPIREG